jgi:hypothetical protein
VALIAAIGAGAWFFAYPELMRRPLIPLV